MYSTQLQFVNNCILNKYLICLLTGCVSWRESNCSQRPNCCIIVSPLRVIRTRLLYPSPHSWKTGWEYIV